MTRTTGYIICGIIVVLIILMLTTCGSARTVPVANSPASAAQKTWVRHWRSQAAREWRQYARARACTGHKTAGVAGLPKGTVKSTWLAAGYRYRHLARRYPVLTAQAVRRMCNPGGRGPSRWWPLCRWLGFPPSQRANCIRCMRLESGGDPTASNGICRSLFQIHVCHARTFRRVTGRPYFNSVYTPSANIKYAVWLWRHEGWSPWVTM